ncbi:uncharacterized protein LOC133905277 isoform X1 [Phragmites australis]|uniref:uncharacterized protein LOC133905277 isoform X1 n=1 Tax=Phragmites australis TaxID=29695 RepID=UPI002D770BB1|nr:uncharacterized protein LOC133905277 isoform X1 [Phragmites australis]
MEGGGSAGGGGGGVLCAAQEPRRQEEEKAGAAARRGAGTAGAMKFRVCTRAPHGVGALLLIGGAAVVGAAVVAWRHAHRRGKDGAENQRDRQPAKEEVLDGGVVEDGKDRASAREIDLSDENLSGEKTEIGSDGLDNEYVENFDQNSSRKPDEITTLDMGCANVEKVDENSSNNDIGTEIAPNDNKDVEASDQSTLSIIGPGIILSKHSDHSDGAQEAESMENTPTAQLMMHQEQLLDDMMTDPVTETDAKLGEQTIKDKSEFEQDENKALAGLVELVSSPALLSLVKSIEKKEPELPGWNETGMKTEQDHTNGELKKHDLISKRGVMLRGAVTTMDRRSISMAIVALIFVVTIGITIIVRLYAPPRATKHQINLQ